MSLDDLNFGNEPSEPDKPRRRRRDKSADSGSGVPEVDPATASVRPDANEPGRTRRARPRREPTGEPKRGAAGTRKTKSVSTLDLSGLAGLFIGLHAAIGDLTHNPELALSDEEGEDYIAAIQRVSSHYNIASTQKSVDIGVLILTMGTIYGTRFVAIAARRRAERGPRERPIRPNGQPPANTDPSTFEIVPEPEFDA